MKKRVIMTVVAVVLVLLVCLVIFMQTPTWRSEAFRKRMGWYSYGHEEHGTYHDCAWHRDVIIAEAKDRFAKANALPNGVPVTWQDLVPFITNGEFSDSTRYPGTPPDYLPKCPCGGAYSINPVGSNVLCSHSYHQWYNCMSRTDRSR